MKSNDTKNFFSNVQNNGATLKPVAPFIARQQFNDRRLPDPSSVLRSGRCPIPTYFEYRMRTGE